MNAVETLCFQTWTMARLRVSSVDDVSHTVTFTGPTNGPESYASLRIGHRFIIENVREALQDPGEWYLGSKIGIIYVYSDPERNSRQRRSRRSRS